ncbi:FG-GAP repeat domain-containing protein [Streptomyces wedmorensis]
MPSARPAIRPSRRRLVAAVTAVLAVTAAVPAAAPAAFAATPAVTAGVTEAATPVPFPVDAKVVGAGTTGFLSQGPNDQYGDQQLRWTPYDGSEPTDFTSANAGYDTTGTDIFVRGDMSPARQFRSVTLRDLGNPGAGSVSFDLGSLFATYVKAVGPRTVLAKTKPDDLGKQQLLIVTDENGTKHSRAVTGLPGITHSFFTNAPAVDGKVIVGYTAGTFDEPKGFRAVVDLETGAVVETYEATEPGHLSSGLAMSASYVAWMESGPQGPGFVAVDRKTKAVKRVPLHVADGYHLALVDNWLVYGVPSRLTEPGQYPNTRLRAVNLPFLGIDWLPEDNHPDQDVELTDYASSTAVAADGTLLVRGGTVDKGEGLYRVSPVSLRERPTVELVATTNQPTALRFLGSQVPDTIDLDRTRQVDLKWQLSRGNADVTVTLIHQGTGRTYSRKLTLDPATDGTFVLNWPGLLDGPTQGAGTPAYNGTYSWGLVAVPQNGIGSNLNYGGSFTVTRAAKPHDYGDNGSPDLFARDTTGKLVRYDTTYDAAAKRLVRSGYRTDVGTGWQTYNRVESVGNIAGTSAPDTIARDTAGQLWLYQGTGTDTRPLSARTRIGTGWQVYNRITGGSDLTGDGKSDVLATDTAGALWLYPGTGNANAPFSARKQIGTGWGTYNLITATGNLGGAPAGDLVARDTTGVLWLYYSKGDGTFAPRVRLGGGWNAFTTLVGTGDANQDGRADLLAYGPNNTVHLYPGTGSWSAPFGARTSSDVLTGTGTNNHVF